MKFKPPDLPKNPTSDQWKWWRKCFIDGLIINEITEDAHKLTLLRTHAGPDLFSLLGPVTAFDDALLVLDQQFQTPTRILYARHQLLTCSQKPGELISDFVKRLKILAHKCECTAVSAVEHQNHLLRDALVAGISSDSIRARLLELDDQRASLNDCITLASAIEISTDYSKTFHSTSSTRGTSDSPSVAAARQATPLNKQRYPSNRVESSNQLCYFCGSSLHPRRNCPAKDSVCNKCGKKGHWSKVCRSQTAAARQEDTSAAAILCSASSDSRTSSRAIYCPVAINGGTETDALIDSGSTHSFITSKLATQLKLPVKKKQTTTRMADNSLTKTDGQVPVNLRLRGFNYPVTLTVIDSLVADIIVGMDVLAQHDTVELNTGGSLPKLSCATFPAMYVKPPDIFSNGFPSNIRPVSTKTRNIRPKDRDFIHHEVERLLDQGIIEESTSPWRAQAFVVRENKPRMVIDYSETVNLFTNLDAYPLTTIETILNKVAENHYFSKIDLTSAYHQVPIKPEDRPFTAFEADGKLLQFTRLAFGLTNAVPAFQRIMDNLVEEHKLLKTYPYMDDITICGSTLEEHDENLEKFLEVARAVNLTLNDKKCVFRTQSIHLLGHVIENGTKRPDPDRLKALMEFPYPKTAPQLNRLVGFFAYHAKWIRHYSGKIKPLLDAQKVKRFPLSTEECQTIDALKTDISNALLAIPEPSSGPLTIETDASGVAIGAILSQAERPIAFFSRTLSSSEQNQSTVEREAMAVVEASRKWREFILSFPTVIKTDQKAISFMFSKQKSRIKNEKLARWRLELSELSYDIVYKPGVDNIPADSLTRTSAATQPKVPKLTDLHDALAHPGITRLWEYIQRHNLPYTLEEVREMTSSCKTCLECKPKFFSPPDKAHLIKATRPYERLNIDIVGPKTPAKGSGRRYLLVIIDEYSRFPFAFALNTITTDSIISCLRQLFALFGTPSFLHSDRGSQFMSEDFEHYLQKLGISHSRTTPYNPQCNGQTERYNGVIWKAIQCLLHSRNQTMSMWESVLPEALAANRSLICTATNETPHSRLFSFTRRGTQGYQLPEWLTAGKQAYMKIHVRNKDDPQVEPVRIMQVINPYFARVEQSSGRIDTVSTRHLSPGPSLPSDDSNQDPNPEPGTILTADSSTNSSPATEEHHPNPDQDDELSQEENSGRPTRNRKPPDRLQIKW